MWRYRIGDGNGGYATEVYGMPLDSKYFGEDATIEYDALNNLFYPYYNGEVQFTAPIWKQGDYTSEQVGDLIKRGIYPKKLRPVEYLYR